MLSFPCAPTKSAYICADMYVDEQIYNTDVFADMPNETDYRLGQSLLRRAQSARHGSKARRGLHALACGCLLPSQLERAQTTHLQETWVRTQVPRGCDII